MAEQTMVERWRIDREQFAREMTHMMNWEPSRWVMLESFIQRVQRASIEAIREPTHDMLVMMWKAHGEEDPSDTAAQFRKAYKTAIDTALKD